MSDIQIGIKVDTSQVESAKSKLLSLAKDLDQVAGVNVKVGGGEQGALVRDMVATARRLEGLSLKIDAAGGRKTPGQEREAARLLEKSRTDAAAYEVALGKVGQQLDALYEKKKRLESVRVSSPAWPQAQIELTEVNRQYTTATGAYSSIQGRFDPVADRARAGAERAAGELAGASMVSGGGGGGGGGLGLGGLLKGAAALYGGLSVLGFLAQSRREYHTMAGLESTLAVRGVGFDRGLSPFGYGPTEEAELALTMNRRTGARGMGLSRTAERFARAGGIDLSTGAGFLGDVYGISGISSGGQRRLTDLLLGANAGSKDHRMEALLEQINANLTTTSRSQGGKGLSEGQIASVVATTAALYNHAGPMGNTPDLFNTLKGGLRMGGGSSFGELLKWSALGGFNGPMTAEKMLDMQRMQDRGLVDPELRARLFGQISKMPGKAAQNLALQQVLFGNLQKPGGAETADMLLNLQGSGALNGKVSGGAADKLLGIYYNTPGAKLNARRAQADRLHLQAGEGLERAFGKFEDVALNTADDILSSSFVSKAINALDKGGAALIASGRGQHADPLLRSVAQKVGIDVELLRSVVANESGFNPKAVSPRGAKGLMQLMPGTAKTLGVTDPFDPRQNVTGGAKYLRQLLTKYGSEEMALAAYNWGPGNLDKYGMGRLPAETRDFVSKVEGTAAERRKAAPLEEAPIIGTEPGSFLGYVGLFQEALVALKTIASNTATRPQAQHLPVSQR